MGMFSENYTGNRCSDCTWADEQEENIKKWNVFFNHLRLLIINHSIENDIAVVYADQLGRLMETMDNEWYENRQHNK